MLRYVKGYTLRMVIHNAQVQIYVDTLEAVRHNAYVCYRQGVNLTSNWIPLLKLEKNV